jgi:hypothetical protein
MTLLETRSLASFFWPWPSWATRQIQPLQRQPVGDVVDDEFRNDKSETHGDDDDGKADSHGYYENRPSVAARSRLICLMSADLPL